MCQRVEDGNEVELLIHEDLKTTIKENYTNELKTLNEHSVRISSSAELPQFGLTIIDSESVWLGIHRQSGGLHGLLKNSNDDAVCQAQRLFEQYLKDSQKYRGIRS
ncbi:transcriptional regulator FilR1 domain-containing protein [Halogeometricum borinquense]